MKKPQVAVILCGSGYKDGSEIRESVATLWALSALNAEARCFAPDAPQRDVVNCLTGEAVAGESRNQLVEAARIARGQVRPLASLEPESFDAVILPGGFGAAKNLCDFALKGSSGSVIPELRSKLKAFHSAGKPVGAICIAPAVVALAFPNAGFTLTVGEKCEASAEIEKLGHRHEACDAGACVVDEKNRIVTTPAYMLDSAPLHVIFEGIRALCERTLSLAR